MKTTAQRQQEWRRKRKSEGWQMHTIWLEPDVAKALDAAIHGSVTKQADRQRLINEAFRRFLNKEL